MHRLRSIHGLRVFLEQFHTSDAVIAQGFGWSGCNVGTIYRELGLDMSGHGLRDAVVSDIGLYTAAIRRVAGADLAAFKIFPYHLNARQLATVIGQSEAVMLHNRNIVHAYISDEIATANGVYGGVDTTRQRAAFDLRGFLAFMSGATEHLESARSEAAAQGIPILSFDHEQLSSVPDPAKLLAESLRMHLPDRSFEVGDYSSVPTRQDTRLSAIDKVTNPDFMREVLEIAGLTACLDSGCGTDAVMLRRACDKLLPIA